MQMTRSFNIALCGSRVVGARVGNYAVWPLRVDGCVAEHALEIALCGVVVCVVVGTVFLRFALSGLVAILPAIIAAWSMRTAHAR